MLLNTSEYHGKRSYSLDHNVQMHPIKRLAIYCNTKSTNDVETGRQILLFVTSLRTAYESSQKIHTSDKCLYLSLPKSFNYELSRVPQKPSEVFSRVISISALLPVHVLSSG